MKLISELIEIPDQVHGGDFVLKLTEGVQDAEGTLRDYVVTDQLVLCFERALDLLKDAVTNRSSKGAFLHGSFGAGKSHFMAVLDLLLAGNPSARSILKLAPVIARHSWTDGRKFLLVPYHLIGAQNLEAAILGQYANHVKWLHPDAPTPGVFAAERIFEDARRLRDSIGDAGFFGQLNRGRDTNGGNWGDLDKGWNAESFEEALHASIGSEERARLVGDLVDNIFTAYRGASQFVSLDEGLSIISRHARALGYDAVVLFLDELVLWLASHTAEPAFINREGQKVAKLVEAQSADRPIPIVSFIARQRDLRELIGENVPGAGQVAFADIFKWWGARFDTITLEDRNLPAIAEKRVLKPRSDAAKIEMDRGFEEIANSRREVFETLQTTHADRQMFRQVYPFSPALVEALVAVSSLLQRERTALKVMIQILVSHRNHLRVGDLVPVGDLWDAIAEGDEPFSEDMRLLFETARKLYRNKLLPILEADHGMRAEDAHKLAWDDAKGRAFRADERIMKTLLLAAMTPEVECFRNLTAGRLAVLNHGSIKSPIAGTEGGTVLGKLQRWVSRGAGEIRIAQGSADPTVSVQLVGVDTQSILDGAKVEDNYGNRLRKLRELIFGQLGIEDDNQLFVEHEFPWRGTKRTCDVVFGSIRDMPDSSMAARGESWKVLIDVPMPPGDSETGPADAQAKLETWQAGNQSTNTIAWIPAHFTLQARTELIQLVIIDRVLSGNRFDTYAAHLSITDRAQARTLLENQRSQLTERIKVLLLGAYGVAPDQAGMIDGASFEPSRRVNPLCSGLQLNPPVGASLGDALINLLDQALQHQFPAHPDFKIELSRSNLRKAYGELQKAAHTADGRSPIEKPSRPVMRDIAVPLRLGQMGEDHFLIDIDYWHTHFLRKSAGDSGPLTVKKLRGWIDDPNPRGLQTEVENLIILTYADKENFSFFQHGVGADATLESLKDDFELRAVNLPSEADWKEAGDRAAKIFGLVAPQVLNASNAARFSDDIKAKSNEHRVACNQYRKSLQDRLTDWPVELRSARRMKTANAVVALVEALAAASDVKVFEAISRVEIATSAEAMGGSFRKAKELQESLSKTKWELFDAIRQIADERVDAARAILDGVRDTLENDELAVGLQGRIARAEDDAIKLLTPPKKPTPPKRPAGDGVEIDRGQSSDLDLAAARSTFKDIERKLEGEKSSRLDLSWTIHRKGPAK